MSNSADEVDATAAIKFGGAEDGGGDGGEERKNKVYKVVLTGGPCGGKTTAQVRLATFFENLGWKVFTVPETATILLGGRVKFSELDKDQCYTFQKDLLATMHQIENTFMNQATSIKDKNVLVICDRGCMDPSAYSTIEDWQKMLVELKLEEFDILCSRYDQVCHLVTAADGAEQFYTLANNATRSEGLEQAIELDKKTRSVWVGHPLVDIIDNSNTAGFEDKVNKLIEKVCTRIGLSMGDRLAPGSIKRKWLISAVEWEKFVKNETFEMENFYLNSDDPNFQHRFRKRTQNGKSTYTLTTREFLKDLGKSVETRMQVPSREYSHYASMRDKQRSTIHKIRRCFMWGNQYFSLDIYKPPLPPPAAHGKTLMFLETFTTIPLDTEFPKNLLPDWMTVEKEITGDSQYSMYSLAKKNQPSDSQRLPFVDAPKYDD